jgi:hypothetical protein
LFGIAKKMRHMNNLNQPLALEELPSSSWKQKIGFLD